MATDWENYAEQMLEVLSANENLVNTAEQDYIPRPDFRPLTKFEARRSSFRSRCVGFIL